MSEAKADASETHAGQERAKHVRPEESELVVVQASKLYDLIQRAVTDARRSGGSVEPLLVDKQQLAQRLSCSAAHIDNLRKQGMPWVRLGEAVRFDPTAVLDWLRRQQPANE